MNKIAIPFLLVLLSACSSLGLQPAETLDQRIAYAYGVQAAVNDATTAALTAGSITKADAQSVLKTSLEARVLLDAARVANGAGDPTTAQGRLTLAVNLLTQLQTFLRSHQ